MFKTFMGYLNDFINYGNDDYIRPIPISDLVKEDEDKIILEHMKWLQDEFEKSQFKKFIGEEKNIDIFSSSETINVPISSYICRLLADYPVFLFDELLSTSFKSHDEYKAIISEIHQYNKYYNISNLEDEELQYSINIKKAIVIKITNFYYTNYINNTDNMRKLAIERINRNNK